AAALPQWAAQTGDSRAASALLLPELLARAPDVTTALCSGRSRPLVGHVRLHRRVDQRLVERRSENGVGQLEIAYLFALQILYIHNRHIISNVMRCSEYRL